MTERMKLTRKQDEQLKKVLEIDNSPASVINAHFFALSKKEPWGYEYGTLNELTMDEMARALYEGYEVEPSSYDIVRENINNSKYHTQEEFDAYLKGVRDTLRAFKIKVDDVNSSIDLIEKD